MAQVIKVSESAASSKPGVAKAPLSIAPPAEAEKTEAEKAEAEKDAANHVARTLLWLARHIGIDPKAAVNLKVTVSDAKGSLLKEETFTVEPGGAAAKRETTDEHWAILKGLDNYFAEIGGKTVKLAIARRDLKATVEAITEAVDSKDSPYQFFKSDTIGKRKGTTK
jgi:hypothetical protein